MAELTPIEWARAEAGRLRAFAQTPEVQTTSVEANSARAIQFLADLADGTSFERVAIGSLRHYAHGSQPINAIAFQLEEWATYQESGMAGQKPFEVRFRMEAATDIMEQVQILLADREVHPAAPVVLAGAALEELLRSMQLECQEPIVGKPGISAYADALRKAEILSRGEVKDITAWADQRNDAAHGRFDDLSRDRARIMVDAINLFISKHAE